MAARISFEEAQRPRVSIVVVAWRSAPYLLECLRAVAAATSGPSYEVIVVLNEASPELLEQIEGGVSGIQLVRNPVNSGFARAVNLGAGRARGEYLVLLNDDAEVLPGWLEALVELADRQPDIGAVGSKVLFPDGTVQEAGAVVWADGTVTNVGRGVLGDSPRYDSERPVDYCSGCSLLVRRALWEELGGFDDAYFPAYYEDVDLCFRLERSGHAVWLQPRSRVLHHLSASTSGPYRSFLLERNRRLFVQRWKEELRGREAPRPDDPLAIDRAVRQRTGEGPVPLAVVDPGLSAVALGDSLGRLRDGTAALLGGSAADSFAAVSVGELDAGRRGAVRAVGVQPVEEDLGQFLRRHADGCSLLLVSSSAKRALTTLQEVRTSLPGVAVLLDAEVLRGDIASLGALGSGVEYFVTTSAPPAGMPSGSRSVQVRPGVVLHSLHLPGGSDLASTDQRAIALTPVRQSSDVLPTNLSHGDIELLGRFHRLQEDYVKHLESQLFQLLDEMDKKDVYASQAERDGQEAAAYARQLREQLERLAKEVAEKDVYIRQKEADASMLWDECDVLRRELEIARDHLPRSGGDHLLSSDTD